MTIRVPNERPDAGTVKLTAGNSFAGNVTYPKGRDLLAVAADVPDDRLLLETDAPFLAPQPQRGRRNEPAQITATYDVVAAARGTTRAALGRLVAANAQRLFRWPALSMHSGALHSGEGMEHENDHSL